MLFCIAANGVLYDRGSDWKVEPERVIAPYSKSYGYVGWHLSTVGHGKPRRNLGGPSPKAKYYSVTDSERVP